MKKIEYEGRYITFDEENHKYVADNGELLTSVTSFIGNFFNKFDAEKIAGKIAGNTKNKKYIGKSKEEIMKLWVDSATFGTKIHNFAENYIKTGITPECTFEKVTSKFIDLLKHTHDIIDTEMVVFDLELGISGTIDLIIRDKKTNDYIICDWKTNDKIDKSNFFSKALSPLDYLDDCNYNKYCLQLNLYEYILEKQGYFPYLGYKKLLYHIRKNKVVEYDIEDMRKEIKIMLEKRIDFEKSK